ncbi:DNA primase [Vibrio aestuarianus]|nr:DNA primase [Vibrio aestuarianus]
MENASKAQNNDMVKKTETNREDKANVIENKIETYTLPFPLRAGVMVKISDLPTNLTAEEAERIASMVKALVNEK